MAGSACALGFILMMIAMLQHAAVVGWLIVLVTIILMITFFVISARARHASQRLASDYLLRTTGEHLKIEGTTLSLSQWRQAIEKARTTAATDLRGA